VPEKLTSHDVIELLRNQYIAPSKPAGGYFCAELPDPTGKRRADLIWVPTTWQERGQIIGHEVKVSRADVVAELADPTKADAWARYCDRWWLVVSDSALIDGLPIPDNWGVMAPPSGRRRRTMTIVKDAPKLSPADKALAFANVITRLHNAGDDTFSAMQRLERDADVAVRTAENLRRENELLLGRLRTAEGGRNAAETARVLAIVDAMTALGKKSERYRYSYPDPELIAVGILDYELVRKRTRSLLTVVDDRVRAFERALAPIDVGHILEGLTGLSRRLTKDADDAGDPALLCEPDAALTSTRISGPTRA